MSYSAVLWLNYIALVVLYSSIIVKARIYTHIIEQMHWWTNASAALLPLFDQVMLYIGFPALVCVHIVISVFSSWMYIRVSIPDAAAPLCGAGTRCLGHWRESMGEGRTKTHTAAYYTAFTAALTTILHGIHYGFIAKRKSCVWLTRFIILPHLSLSFSQYHPVFVLCKVCMSHIFL